MARPPQNSVQVRIDLILYTVIAVVAILALSSVVTGRVDVALVGTLLTFATGALTGWLTYLRLCRSRNGKGDEAGEGPEPSPGEGADLGPAAPSPKGRRRGGG